MNEAAQQQADETDDMERTEVYDAVQGWGAVFTRTNPKAHVWGGALWRNER